MCEKIPFDSQAEARDMAIGMSRDRKVTMKAYFCENCEKWHMATEGKKPGKKRVGHNKRNHDKYPFRFRPELLHQNKKKKKK